MTEYVYKGRDSGGKLLSGTIEADSLDEAIEDVQSLGLQPIDVYAADLGTEGDIDLNRLFGRYFRPSVKLADLIVFVRQLRALLVAGVDIVRALRGLAENTRNERLADAIRAAAAGLENGQTLHESMARHPEVFPRLLLAMVRVGEESGRLEQSLKLMNNSLQQERITRQRVSQALRYPSFVMIAIVVAMGVVNLFVIPSFAQVFSSVGADLPLPTRMLLMTSNFFVEKWPLLLVGLAGMGMLVRVYLKSEEGRYQWDRLKLQIPGIGMVVRLALLSRFSRTFSMAQRSGVPLLAALESVAQATDNAYVARGINGLSDGISKGETLSRVAARSKMFTPMVLQMMAVGEETGDMAEMLDQVAEFYEGEVDAELQRLSSYIEPFIISFIALLVLTLALGIFLPMWQLTGIF